MVTIMITSVILILAIVLLQRIIPYSRQIRSMQDSMQAYYTARSEAEIGKYEFKKEWSVWPKYRENYEPAGMHTRIEPVSGSLALGLPDLQTTGATKKLWDVVIVSKDAQLPIQLRLYKEDAALQAFGTSRSDPTKHILNAVGGGVTFDVGGIEMNSPIKFNPKISSTNTDIAIEFTSSFTEFPSFFGEGAITGGSLELMEIVGNSGVTLQSIFQGLIKDKDDCDKMYCYLNLKLPSGSTESFIDFTLNTNYEIPDLNAILVADGISGNGLYHSRIIELLPVTQSI